MKKQKNKANGNYTSFKEKNMWIIKCHPIEITDNDETLLVYYRVSIINKKSIIFMQIVKGQIGNYIET